MSVLNLKNSQAALVRQTLALAVARGGAMILSLLSVTLTYKILSPSEFALFNLAMFLLATSSAICQPLNRAFWLSRSSSSQGRSYNGTALVTVLIVFLGMLASTLAKGYDFLIVLSGSIAASVYGLGKVIERYTYGKLLVSGRSAIAVIPIILFALSDFSLTAVLYKFGVSDVSVRLFAPSATFIACVIAIVAIWPQSQFNFRFEPLCQLLIFIRSELLSTAGGKFVLLGCLLSAATMIDRPVIYFFPLLNADFSAAYLLALSYAVAIQTLLNLLFDLARTHVFQDGEWRQGAKGRAALILFMASGTIGVSSAAYPVLLWLGFLPKLIGWFLWTALLAKALVIALSIILNVDNFQQGKVRQIVIAVSVVLLASLFAIGLIYHGFSQNTAASVLILICAATVYSMSAEFFRRAVR